MTDNNKPTKKKVQDLTGGAYQPSEQFKTLADGTVVRLEDPTTPKPQEEVEKEQQERISEEKSE